MHKIIKIQHKGVSKPLQIILRNYVANAATASKDNVASQAITSLGRKMKGWQIHSYGDIDELQCSDKLRFPKIKCSTDLLVKVHSSGVNPIDVSMVGGYGAKMLNVLRCNQNNIEFPLILGREFCGEVVQKGMGCSANIGLGDVVCGVVPVHRNGSHAEYVVVPESCISRKPNEISVVEAGGILYAGLTAWSGIFITGLLGGIEGALTSRGGNGQGKRILVLGASGGVGSAAVQILKAEKATVIASCSTDAISIVKQLGADHVIDYSNQNQIDEFSSCGPYDFILDCAGQGQNYAEKFAWSYQTYITFSSPLLRNVDNNGLAFGMIKNLADIVEANTRSIVTRKGTIKWAYFIPAQHGIEYLLRLVDRKKFLPQIDSVFGFDEAKSAYEKVKNGHLRGKVIIDFEKKTNN